MNRKLLALAITAALTAPFAAQAAPTVYGQLNLSVDLVDWDDGTDDGQDFEVNSNSSRLGVKGEEALTDGYSAVYKAEWAVSGDTAGGNDLVGRDRYLGLKAGWGTLKLGAYDTPLKSSQGSVDQFNDMTHLDMGNFISGENRINNIIGYESPKIADSLSFNVAVQSGEDTVAGDDDAISMSVVYEANGLYLAAAMDNDMIDNGVASLVADLVGPTGSAEPYARDAVRLTAGYTMDNLQLGALLQVSEFNDDKRVAADIGFLLDSVALDEQSFLLSAAYTSGKNVIKGQVVMANYDVDITSGAFTGSGSADATALMFGMDHNFTQTTKAYAQLGLTKFEADGMNDVDVNVLTVGMQTKF